MCVLLLKLLRVIQRPGVLSTTPKRESAEINAVPGRSEHKDQTLHGLDTDWPWTRNFNTPVHQTFLRTANTLGGNGRLRGTSESTTKKQNKKAKTHEIDNLSSQKRAGASGDTAVGEVAAEGSW